MAREIIEQRLEIKDWPLRQPGDEKFFGYVVAIGIFPREWQDEDGMTHYVDFSYNDTYERYRLPNDESLRKQLFEMLLLNLDNSIGGGIYGKVWIKRLEKGYAVDLP